MRATLPNSLDRNLSAADFTARHITQYICPDGFSGLTGINDGRGGRKAVLKLFDQALAN